MTYHNINLDKVKCYYNGFVSLRILLSRHAITTHRPYGVVGSPRSSATMVAAVELRQGPTTPTVTSFLLLLP